MTGRSRFRFRFRGVMSLVKSIASQFFDILQKEEAASNTNVFYDPADLTSLRVNTDGSGGNPTVGDPVGMMLDKSGASGSMEEFLAGGLNGATELVTNGTFDDTSWWGTDASWTISGGVATVTGNDQIYSPASWVPAAGWLYITFDVTQVDTAGTLVVVATNPPQTLVSVSATGTYSVIAYFNTTDRLRFGSGTGSTFRGSIDNVSAKAIPGHHAIAPNDNARPVLFDDPDLTAAALTDNGQRGDELVTNGQFYSATNLDGWNQYSTDANNTITLVSGEGVDIVGDGSSALRIEQTNVFVANGDYYELEIDVTVNPSDEAGIKVQYAGTDSSIGVITTSGIHKFTFRPNTSTLQLFRRLSGSVTDLRIRSISVRKVLTAFDERGAELVTNGAFDADSDWTPTTNSSISAGALNFSSASFAESVSQDISYVAGTTVSITVDVTVSSGIVDIWLGGTASFDYQMLRVTSSGSYTVSRVSSGTDGTLYIRSLQAGTTATIDNISVKEVLYPNLVTNGTFDTDSDWTKAAGVTISGGTLNFSSVTSGSAAYVSGITTQYKWYRVRCYCSSYTSGGFRLVCNGASVLPDYQTATGWFEAIMFVDSTNTNIGIQADSSFTGSIDNVIVQELPASIDRKYYLDTDGSDDWMEVTPTLNLGEQWWHVGAWQSDTVGKRPFATSTIYQGAARHLSGRWVWYDSTNAAVNVTTSDPATKHVFTIEQSDTNSLSVRYDGVQESASMTPYDDSGSTQGLALFSQENDTYTNGLDGRFYGGSWGQGQVDYDELTVLQDYLGTTTQPPIDPPDVTEYANVYELLAAQTGAVLFDIDDTTSLRVGRNGSGGVPVDGDPVGMMLDVSDTGGATVAAATAARPELVTNGTFDTDSDWTKGTGWTISGGTAVFASGGTQYANIYQPVSVVSGDWYIMTFELNSISANNCSVRVLNGTGLGGATIASDNFISSPKSGQIIFQASSAVVTIGLQANLSAQNLQFDNISVKKISSHAAIAPSDSARPTLATENSPISSREVLTTTYGWTITDGGRA